MQVDLYKPAWRENVAQSGAMNTCKEGYRSTMYGVCQYTKLGNRRCLSITISLFD